MLTYNCSFCLWTVLFIFTDLFERDKSVISRHLHNIFKEKELTKNAVVAKFATTAADAKTYQVEYFNLDAIISVGYRVNSKSATEFRIWATKILRQYVIKGYAINNKSLLKQKERLRELHNVIAFLEEKSNSNLLESQEKEILILLSNYSKALTLLDQYDKNRVVTHKGKKALLFAWNIRYDKFETKKKTTVDI